MFRVKNNPPKQIHIFPIFTPYVYEHVNDNIVNMGESVHVYLHSWRDHKKYGPYHQTEKDNHQQ